MGQVIGFKDNRLEPQAGLWDGKQNRKYKREGTIVKICYLGNITSPIGRNIAEHFALDNEVHFVTFDRGCVPNICVHRVGRHSNTSFSKVVGFTSSFSKVKKVIRQIEPDILHAHMVTSYGVIGGLVDFQPFVVSAWGSDILYLAERYWHYRKTAQWVLDKSQLVTASAEVMVAALVKLGTRQEKIVNFYYGINIDRFNSKGMSIGTKSKTIVLCTRYFEKPQNVVCFIKAIPFVLKEISSDKVEFWVIGSGSQEKRIKTLTGNLNLGGVIRFLGEIAHERMPDYYNLADVYVSPAISDTNHVSLTEAMACGVFPVVTDIPANRVWINDGVNGLLAPVRNPEALSRKIVEAVKRRDLRDNAVARNLEIITSKALWEDNIKKLEVRYRELLDGKKNRGRYARYIDIEGGIVP